MEQIRSISYDQTEILKNILVLHVPSGQIDCDPTYSKGKFYASGVIPQPRLRFDLYPSGPGVEKADCRHLPIPDESLQCMMFDPPFSGDDWAIAGKLYRECHQPAFRCLPE